MELLVNFALQSIIYIFCFALFISIYGYIIYHLMKFIFRVVVNAYTRVKADWKSWRSSKNK